MRTAMNETQVRLRLYGARAENVRRLPPPPRMFTIGLRGEQVRVAFERRLDARGPQPEDDLETVGQAA
jgi:hypothetical protein